MFNKIITETPFTQDLADEIFTSVNGAVYLNDVSFVSTLRALMVGRSGFPARVYLQDMCSADYDQCITLSPFNPEHFHDVLIILTTQDHALIHDIDTRFANDLPDFRELADLKQFVAPYMVARFYIDEEKHKTVVFVENLSIRRWHLLQALIPRYFPWIFQDNPISDEERELLSSLTHKYSNDYERIIEIFSSKVDFRTLSIQKCLGGFERKANLALAKKCEEEVNQYTEQMHNIIIQYDSYLRSKEELNAKMHGYLALAQACDAKDSELVDYFKCNKSLMPINTRDTSFSFIVNTYLESYDPEMYETYSENDLSYLYHGYSRPAEFENRDDFKLFLDAIFSEEPTLKIRVCAYFTIKVGGSVDSYAGYDFPPECRDRIPNPHLHYFDCLGNYQRYIRECLLEGNIIGAVEQCVASAKSINITEAITVRRFLVDLMMCRNRVIELPDGSLMTAVDALEWLKKNQKNEEEGSHGETDCVNE